MKIHLEPPQGMECLELTVNGETGKSTFTPIFLRSQKVTVGGYITLEGKGGMKITYRMLVSGNTGNVSLQRVDRQQQQEVDFDLDPAKFDEQRQKRRAASATSVVAAREARGAGEKGSHAADPPH